MKLHDPFLVARYAMKNDLVSAKGWEWTKDYIDSDGIIPKMVHAYKVSKFMKTIKFGVEVPQTMKQAFAMDEADSSNLWAKAMDSEIQSLHDHDTFVVLEEGHHIPPGYKQIPYH